MKNEAQPYDNLIKINDLRNKKAGDKQFAEFVKKEFEHYHHKENVYNDQFLNKLKDKYRGKIEIKSVYKDGGESPMDDGTQMILERLERDSREREARYHADAQEREQRTRESEDRFRNEIKERDEKFREESKEREDRLIQLMVDTKQELKEDISDLKSDFRELRTDFKDLKTSTDNTNKWIIGLAITTIAAIVAIAAAVWIGQS